MPDVDVDTLQDCDQHQGAEDDQARDAQEAQAGQHQARCVVSLYQDIVRDIWDEGIECTSDEKERSGDTLPMLCSSLENWFFKRSLSKWFIVFYKGLGDGRGYTRLRE